MISINANLHTTRSQNNIHEAISHTKHKSSLDKPSASKTDIPPRAPLAVTSDMNLSVDAVGGARCTPFRAISMGGIFVQK